MTRNRVVSILLLVTPLLFTVACQSATGSGAAIELAGEVAQVPSFVLPAHPRSAEVTEDLGLTDKESIGASTGWDGPESQALNTFGPIPPPQLRVGGNRAAGQAGLLFNGTLPLRGTPLATPTLLPTRPAPGTTASALAADSPTPTLVPTEVFEPPTVTPPTQPTDLPTAHPVEAVESQRFVVVADSSTVTYQLYVQYAGVDVAPQLITGKTQQIRGELLISLGAVPELLAGSFDVNLPSLNSRDPRRDLAIRADWLESDRFPLARFEASGLENAPTAWAMGKIAKFTLRGELTIRNVTRDVSFEVDAMRMDDLLTGTATTEILMTDFGFEPPVVGSLVEALDGVTLIVYLTAKAE